MLKRQKLINALTRIPYFRSMWLRKQHPVEWELIHQTHKASSDHPSVLHFSVNKAATQYVKDLLGQVGAENGLAPVHLHGYSFNSDLPYFDRLTIAQMRSYEYLFKPQGYVYSVFGGAISGIPSMERYRSVLMVRDPRDVLTSMYYSVAYSHAVPDATGNKRAKFIKRREHTQQIDIDQFVLENAESERAIYQRYLDEYVGKIPALYLTRYEEMTADFDTWFNGLLDHCRLKVSPDLKARLYAEAESIRPAAENVKAHIRKGLPGDYLNKLKSETIEKLNLIFGNVLQGFQYK
jgi:hypothetical protein